jgi:hypothetical protein
MFEMSGSRSYTRHWDQACLSTSGHLWPLTYHIFYFDMWSVFEVSGYRSIERNNTFESYFVINDLVLYEYYWSCFFYAGIECRIVPRENSLPGLPVFLSMETCTTVTRALTIYYFYEWRRRRLCRIWYRNMNFYNCALTRREMSSSVQKIYPCFTNQSKNDLSKCLLQ